MSTLSFQQPKTIFTTVKTLTNASFSCHFPKATQRAGWRTSQKNAAAKTGFQQEEPSEQE
jgi:hypothetical protein